MWKSINVNQQTRFIKYEREQVWHKVYYSDVVNIWMEKLTSSSLSERCKEMNSLVEAEPEDLAKHVRTLIVDSEEDIRITSNGDGATRTLQIESKLAGIPFYFMFRLEKMDANVVCMELTVPLMLLAVQQQARLAQLQEMLIAKDAEIEQYKLEGAVLKKRKVETDPYRESCLAQTDLGIRHSDEAPESVYLFSKLSSLLPPVPTVKENSSKRKMEIIKTEFEEKLEAEPFGLSTAKITSVKDEESPADVPSVVKHNVRKSKKTKLRI